MTTKEKLAIEYINLKKQFEGDNFEENLTDNQIWYLTKRNSIADFKRKIEAIKKDIDDKDMQLKREAYFLTPEGQDYKKKIEDLIANYRADWKKIRDDFENWIINKVNEMVPGKWTARLSLGSYMSGNVEIGLVNRDPKRNFPMEFGHEFTIYFDNYNYGEETPRFELNYGTLGAFDLFNDETRPLYLNGLATISNNKEFLHVLMEKFIENCNRIKEISKNIDDLNEKLDNPKI